MTNKKEERRQQLVDCMMFVLGRTSEKPKTICVENYIDGRARVVDLLQMREYHAVVNSKYKKDELINFFCNLLAFERKALLEKIPDLIIALPSDCDTLKIARPSGIAFRSSSFSGKSVEYCVFEIKEVLQRYQDLPVDAPTKKKWQKPEVWVIPKEVQAP